MNSEAKNIKGRNILIELLRSGQTVDVMAGGLSMFPFLLPADTLRVKPIVAEKLKRGQIVVYEQNSKIISHRYIKTVDGKILCKGDGLTHYDPLVDPENILGIVIARIRKNKTKNLVSAGAEITGYLVSFATFLTGVFFHYLSFMWYKWFFKNANGKHEIIEE